MPSTAPRLTLPLPIYGVRRDFSQQDVPPGGLWTSSNLIMRDGVLRSRPPNGRTTLGAPTLTTRATGVIAYMHNDGTQRVVLAHTTGWEKYAGGAPTNITGGALTGGDTDQQIFRVMQKAGGTTLIGTNGADTMKEWNGTAATYADVGGTPPRCKSIMVLFNRVLALNLLSGATVSSVGVTYSAFNDPDTWGNTISLLTDTPGPIVGGLEMGNFQGAIYKTDAVYMVTAQSALEPFNYSLKQSGIEGPISKQAIVALPDGTHAYLGRNRQIYTFNGQSVQPAPESVAACLRTDPSFANSLGASTIDRAFGYFDTEFNELWFYTPAAAGSGAQIGLAVKWPSWAPYPMTYSSAPALLPSCGGYFPFDSVSSLKRYHMIGLDNGNGTLLITPTPGGATDKTSADTDAVSTYYISTSFDSPLFNAGDPVRSETITESETFLEDVPGSATSFAVAPLYSNYGEVAAVGTSINLPVVGPYQVGHRQMGRRIGLRFTSTGAAAQNNRVMWKGAQIYVPTMGLREKS